MNNRVRIFRKKPVVVSAIQFFTNNDIGSENMNKIVNWINQGKDNGERHAWHNGTDIFINTLEGEMKAIIGDFIIKGINEEFYPCKPDIFEKTYEEVLP